MENIDGYDFIGDVHGHADTLEAMLRKLGYAVHGGAYRHPARQAVFIGDLVDRGPKIRETLCLVRAMREAGTALVIAGNHEMNAICYHTVVNGQPLRPWTEKNKHQHAATLRQLAEPFPGEWTGWLQWMQTLPLYLELPGVRAVHAAWSAESIAKLKGRSLEDLDLLTAGTTHGTPEYHAVGFALHGPEVELPEAGCYADDAGCVRREIRAKWFGDTAPLTYADFTLPWSEKIPATALPAEVYESVPQYGLKEPPVFFGHYALRAAKPVCLAPNAACIDYAIAKDPRAPLTAYRWSGEQVLSDDRFVTVPTVF